MYNPRPKLKPIEAFQLFCLESYRSTKNRPALEAFKAFKQLGVFHFLASGYEVLHTQSAKYIVSEIDQYIQSHNGTISR